MRAGGELRREQHGAFWTMGASRRVEIKSMYGNELWRGSAETNQNVEVLRLRGFQRTQPVNFGCDHISSQAS